MVHALPVEAELVFRSSNRRCEDQANEGHPDGVRHVERVVGEKRELERDVSQEGAKALAGWRPFERLDHERGEGKAE